MYCPHKVNVFLGFVGFIFFSLLSRMPILRSTWFIKNSLSSAIANGLIKIVSLRTNVIGWCSGYYIRLGKNYFLIYIKEWPNAELDNTKVSELTKRFKELPVSIYLNKKALA